MEIKQRANSLFSPLWKQRARYYLLMGGRGRGGSTAASQYILSKVLAPGYFRCAIMRAIHSDIRHSIWRELNDRIDEQNLRTALHITENEMNIDYGKNSVHAHGFKASSGSHTAKLKSLASYNCVVVEEADEIGEAEFMMLDDSLRTVKGDISVILVFNSPPKSHWLIRRFFNLEEMADEEHEGFYIPHLKTDVEAIHIGGTYKDNLKNLDAQTVRRYEEYRNLKPHYFHQVIEGLVPETIRGRIYTGWQLIDRIPNEARLVRFGEDFGWFPDPACAVSVYYWNGSYVIDELAYGNYLSNAQLASSIRDVSSEVPTIADSAEPKSIDEQKRLGINVRGCEKGADSVIYRIKVVSSAKIFVTRRSKNVWDSYENYSWDEDKDGNPKNEPVHTYSHAMDAIGYPLVDLLRGLEEETTVSVRDYTL